MPHDQVARDDAPKTGTTIVACSFDGGVVVGADSRVSTGTYVSNRASNKIAPLADNVYLLRSGSAADTQAVTDYVRLFVNQHEMELQRQPTVKTVAHLVMQMNYNNKSMLQGAMIIGGWDAEAGGQVYGCPIGGTLVRQSWATDGSGSTYLWGYMDAYYRDNFTAAEAHEFVCTALALAMARDGSSGGVMRTVTITKDGSEHKFVPPKLTPLMWDEHVGGTSGGIIV